MTSVAISLTTTLALPLQILSEKLDVLRLAFYTAPVSCGALVPVFFLREVGAQLPLCSLSKQFCPGSYGVDLTCSKMLNPMQL